MGQTGEHIFYSRKIYVRRSHKDQRFIKRLETAHHVTKFTGGELKAIYYTMGQYDFVLINASIPEAALNDLMIGGVSGVIRTETLVAIPTEKETEIVKELPLSVQTILHL